MYAEDLTCKFNWKYTSELSEGFEINYMEDVEREIIYCKNEEDYIRCFVEGIKENIIRKFNNLNKVKIIISIIDDNNIYHKIISTVRCMMSEFLKLKIINNNIQKSIFIIIYYEEKKVFLGSISFEGII